MNANDLLSLLIQVLFILIGVVTIIDYLRHRDNTRRDIALMFGALAMPFMMPHLVNLTGGQAAWLGTVGSLFLITQPYLLLRVVQYFEAIPPLLMLSARVSLVVSWIGIIVATWFTPLGALVAGIAIIIAFILTDAYAMLVFVRGALSASGVVRNRLRLAAAGSGLLALTLVVLLAIAITQSQSELVVLIGLLVLIASALSYYVGFVPPRWLRRAWQLAELRKFLLSIGSQSTDDRLNIEQSLDELCRSANLAVGGMLATVVERDEVGGWYSRQVCDTRDELLNQYPHASIIERTWRERKPTSIRLAQNVSGGDRRLLEIAGADTLLVAPINSDEHVWGLLLVFLKNSSLFIDDDVDLTALLAQQSAIFWKSSMMVTELHRYSEQLEKRVEERTLELRESREQVLKLNAELEKRVEERTAELSAVNRELEAFSYSVSHDLRAPLRAMDGFSQALLEDQGECLDEQGLHFVKRIRAGSQRMGQLIDSLLHLSHLTRTELQIRNVHLSELVRAITVDLQEQYPDRQVEMVIEDYLVVRGDENLLRAALNNLLSNAWKFTSKNPQARVEFGIIEHNGQRAYFVRDNGVGFDMTYANKLFGPFQRLHNVNEFDGNGIGLATVERIVQRHGGRIWADAALGTGATFYFTL